MFAPQPFGKKQPFVYQVPISLAALGTQDEQLTLASDSVFQLHQWGASSDQSADDDVQPNTFAVLIKANDMDLMNRRIPQRILCGPANIILMQRRPIRFAPKTQFVFTFQNLVNATNEITFTLHGYKLIDF